MKHIYPLLILILLSSCYKKTSDNDTLADALYGFNNIQDSTKTKVWWFHGETETTKEGITADLEAYKKAGVGGVVYYDQSHGKAENALPGFSEEWWEMLRFSAEEAQRLGLSFEINISNGFVAGGAWITPEYGMKRLAANEIIVKGAKYFEDIITPPSNYIKDVAVLAFPIPTAGHKSTKTETYKLSSNNSIDLESIFDLKINNLTKIPIHKPGSSVFINIEFENEFDARSITYEVRPKGKATTSATNVPAPPQETFVGTGYRILPDLGQLEVSTDGINYTKVCDLKPIYRAHESWRQKTISFPTASGKYFRLNLHDWWEEDDRSPDMQLGKVVLDGAARVDQWEEKAALFSEYIESENTPSYSNSETIDINQIINITDKMDANGTIKWDVPEGDWKIIRFAYIPTGGRSKHGRKNLLGPECDKLSAKAAEFHWNNYAGKIIDSLKASSSGNVIGVVMDSHEAGAQNWTDNFIEEFAQRQGYDPTLFLPAMMGYVINDKETTTGFLYDIRRNVSDMIADNYYGTFNRLCRENGITFTAQAVGNALCIVSDPIKAKSRVDKPQGEFWPIHPDGNYDIKESSSAAHMYGKNIASAEAYTDAKYSHSIADLKTLADYAYAYGINEFVICASAYQPWLDKTPGNTGGGRHYCINRNNTWWDYSTPFWEFQARCAYMMRKGTPSIDLCVYLGENAPVKILTHRLPDIPGGFDFDAFTTDALITRMSSKNNKIHLPNDMSYSMMILPRNGELTLEALRKIASMVKDGITIYGPKANLSGTFKDIDNKEEYHKLANQLWGDNIADSGFNKYGKGRVFWGMPLEEAIKLAEITPDITMDIGNTKDNMIYFSHRKLKDADVYFLANRKDEIEQTLFTFAEKATYAQLWNPATGERFALDALQNENGTSIELEMHPRESFFIVLTNKDEALPKMKINKSERKEDISNQWNVFFDPQLGGPGDVIFDTLIDWTNHTNTGIKYYSGTAVYKKEIDIASTHNSVSLDLGNPDFVARVFVNSMDTGIIWCSPWTLDISKYLQSGKNNIEIHVANSLINRMVYDESLPHSKRITYAYPSIASEKDSLIPSGIKKAILIYN